MTDISDLPYTNNFDVIVVSFSSTFPKVRVSFQLKEQEEEIEEDDCEQHNTHIHIYHT